MMTRITDMHGDHQPESSGWLFKSPLAGGGAYCGGPNTGGAKLVSLETFAHNCIHDGETEILIQHVVQNITFERIDYGKSDDY